MKDNLTDKLWHIAEDSLGVELSHNATGKHVYKRKEITDENAEHKKKVGISYQFFIWFSKLVGMMITECLVTDYIGYWCHCIGRYFIDVANLRLTSSGLAVNIFIAICLQNTIKEHNYYAQNIVFWKNMYQNKRQQNQSGTNIQNHTNNRFF